MRNVTLLGGFELEALGSKNSNITKASEGKSPVPFSWSLKGPVKTVSLPLAGILAIKGKPFSQL